MPFDRQLYPQEWPQMRAERLQAANYRCEGCGVSDRSIQESAKGEPYMVHLSIAHRNQYETWRLDADTQVLCQRCHRRYDRQFSRRSGTRRYYTPLGYASVYATHAGRTALVDMPRTLDDLRDEVAALPARAEFEVQLVVLAAVVGNAHYRKAPNGSLFVLGEYGPCAGLAGQLEPAPPIAREHRKGTAL